METVIGRLTSFAASVECVTKSLEDNGDDALIRKNVITISDVLSSAWVQGFKNSKPEDGMEKHFQLKFFAKQLEEVVIGLWNATITRQYAKSLQASTLVILRQFCLDLLLCPFCAYIEHDSNSKPKSYINRRIMMATKCGKAWLEIGDLDRSEKCLLGAFDDVKTLMNFMDSSKDENSDSKKDEDELLMLNKCQVTILCYLSEAAFEKQNYEDSFSYLQQCSVLSYLTNDKNFLYSCEKERICSLAYNYGLRRCKDYKEKDALKWLVFCCDYGKQYEQCDKTLMAQCYRLLAHVYCEMETEENLVKSLEAVETANNYFCHPSGLQLKRKKKTTNQTSAQVLQPKFRIQSENVSVSHEDIVREQERERHLAEGFSEVKSIFQSQYFDRLGISPKNVPCFRLKIIVKNPTVSEMEVKSILSDLLRHPDLKVDVGLRACRQLNSDGKYDACEFGLKELLSRFAGSRHVGRVHAERLQAAIKRLPVSDAVDFTKNFFDDNDVISSFDDDVSKQVQLLLWEQASKCQEAGEWLLCYSWYEQSYRVFMHRMSVAGVMKDQEKSMNIAKLLRNQVNCLLNLSRTTEAEDVARKALEFDSSSVLSYFSLFKVLVTVGKQKDAIDCISSLAHSSDSSHVTLIAGKKYDMKYSLICLAAQHALEKNKRQIAMATLRHLAMTGNNDKAKLTAYRCLVRLYLTICDGMNTTPNDPQSLEVTSSKPGDNNQDAEKPMDEETKSDFNPNNRQSVMQAAIDCIKEAHQVLLNLKKDSKLVTSDKNLDQEKLLLPGDESHVITEEEFNDEVTWFMKITWNIALQYNDNPLKMKELFFLCKEILALARTDQSILLRQKTCLLMCAACALSIARNLSGKDQVDVLNDTLNIAHQCREICRDLAACQDKFSPQKPDKSILVLKLYHFEALAKLTGHGETEELQNLFQEIAQMPQADSKTFETLAALSMESPAQHPGLCKLSLKTALKYINIYLEKETQDSDKAQYTKKRSALYRCLVDTCLNEGSATDPTNKDTCWTHINEIYQLIQHDKKSIPELDSLWFAIRSWNVGVRLFSADHVVAAEKWCSLALRLLTQLDRFKESYETHMNHAYREILSRKDALKSKVSVF